MVALAALALLAGAGCADHEEITRYTVERPPPAEMAGSAIDEGESRDAILGAIVPRGEQTWFFKLAGPVAAVNDEKVSFVKFIRSLKFGEKGPEWTLPRGWAQEPASGMRYATITIDAAVPLELSVIPLPTGEGTFDDYLLANLNRWQGELQRGPIAKEDLDERTVKLELDGAEAWLVALDGRLRPSAMGRAPFAGAGSPFGPPAARSADRKELPFSYDLPEGWKKVDAGPMVLAAFEVGEGGQKGTITISAAGGDLAANVNRWRGLIGLAPLPAKELKEHLHPIDLGGKEGTYVELTGPEQDGKREAILGAVAEAAGAQWFFKFRGDAGLAEREKDRFRQFVRSVRFRGREEEGNGQ